MITVIILSFRTVKSGQSVQTQIRLPLEEQSDQGLHYLLFYLHILWHYFIKSHTCILWDYATLIVNPRLGSWN